MRVKENKRRLWQRPNWARFAGPNWADDIMSVPVTDDFHAKQGRSTGRWILQSGDQRLTVYLKRHYRLPWWHGLLTALWPGAGLSPAMQEWRHLQWARAQGLPVPAPVAAGEFIGPRYRLQSFLAIEELTGMIALHQAIPLAAARLEPSRFRLWKRGLIEEMVRLTRALHDRSRYHKDLYLCHFYIPREDTERIPEWRGRVHMIDLHRLGHHPWTGWLWQAKDLAELLYSCDGVQGVDVRDRLCFWRVYLGGQRNTLLNRWLRGCILFKWRGYQRHNAKKAGKRRGVSPPCGAGEHDISRPCNAA